jgi:hypothetical protein
MASPLKRVKTPFLIVSNGECFGIAEFAEQPSQIKTKEFDSEEWLNQHRVTQRERRQWWPDSDSFYVYRVKNWYPYEGVKLYEDGKVISEPRLSAEQWRLVSTAKELPKQIILESGFVELTGDCNVICGDKNFYNRELKPILVDTDETIPLYSLALVRNPRMRVSKKKDVKQEGDDMPFAIRHRDNEYCVVKINEDETEETMACHKTEGEAEAQLAALRINVEAEEGEGAVHNDKPRKRKPRKKEKITALFDGDDVTYTHETGWEFNTDGLDKVSEPEKAKKAGFMEGLRNVAKSIGDFLKSAETEEDEAKLFVNEVGVAQKVINGEVWHFTYSTNAFEDREGEIFSTKALEDYVTANDLNKDKGHFNLWHINEEDGNFNTDFAKKQWQGVVGRFLVEAGPYLRDDKGRAARKFFKKFGSGHPEIAPEGWGCSPEFRYLPEERASGTYKTIWITRTSTLPKFAAANTWTETRQFKHGGTKMALSDQQKKAAVEMFGDEFVNQMMQEAEDKTAELESAGVAHKGEPKSDKTEEIQTQPEPQQVNINMEELAAEVGKQFGANLQPMAEAMTAMATELKELTEWKAKQEKKQGAKEQAETPKFVFEWKRASESDETIVTEDDGLKNQKPQEANAGATSDPWLQVFNK